MRARCPEGRERATGVRVLIVEANSELSAIWRGFLEAEGLDVFLAADAHEAFDALRGPRFDACVLDIELPGGAALSVADFATYRDPDLPIIAVTARGFFSDSAIFELIPNARGLLRTPIKPADMAALVEHYGGRRSGDRRSVETSSGG